MEIKEWIETRTEQQNWTQFLMEHSKEELAELIVDRMVRDSNFSREIYYKLSKQSVSTMEKIKAYETAVNNEINQRTPDVNLIVILSDKLIECEENTYILLEQLKLYVSVIKNLDLALVHGAGYANEDEYVLFELMDHCFDLMIKVVEERNNEMTSEKLGEVIDYLKIESEAFSSFDGENRIKTALIKIVSLTKGGKKL